MVDVSTVLDKKVVAIKGRLTWEDSGCMSGLEKIINIVISSTLTSVSQTCNGTRIHAVLTAIF